MHALPLNAQGGSFKSYAGEGLIFAVIAKTLYAEVRGPNPIWVEVGLESYLLGKYYSHSVAPKMWED